MGSFNLKEVALSIHGFSILLPILCQPCVTELDLADSGIGEDAVILLAQTMLASCAQAFQTLRLENNAILGHTAKEVIPTWAKSLASIIMCNLRLNRFSSGGIRPM